MSRRTAALVPSLLALAAACGGGVAVPGSAPSAPSARPAPAPSSYRAGGPWAYRYERTDTVISMLPNGGRQQLVLERRLHLGWQVNALPTGLELVVTIDSARVIGVPGGARAMEDSVRGTVVRAALSPAGRLSGITSTTDNGIAHAFRAELPWLVPLLTVEGAAPVVDTVDVTVRFGVVDAAERGVRSTTADSAIVMAGTLARDGVSPQLTLQGGGTRRTAATLRGDGRLDAVTGRDSVAMTVTVTQMGQAFEIIQLGGYALTPLP